MLVLSQVSWMSVDFAASLRPKLEAARRTAMRRSVDGGTLLVLLPQASDAPGQPAPTEADLVAQLSALARSVGVMLAGSARVRDPSSAVVSIRGFLISDKGERLLSTAKISPELVAGFDDSTCALGVAAEFAVARTPLGQIGLLPGEDILYATYARSLVFNGAEIILNPCQERLDDNFDLRQCSRFGRAGENVCYVAVASPVSVLDAGAALSLPPATALYSPNGKTVAARASEDFIYPDLDLDLLRRARVNPQRSFPALVRANLYGSGYARAAAATVAAATVAAATVATAAGSTPSAPRTAVEWRGEATRRFDAAQRAHPLTQPKYEEQYEALLVQHCARLIPLDRSVDAAAVMQRNLDEALALAGSRANMPAVRLCVFPEFWLTGPGGIGAVQRTVADMERVAITYPGPIFDRIAEFAQRHRVYVAFQNFELHPRLPHRVFNSAFLLDDSGKLVHTYRKNQCADVWGLLPDTTPGSILKEYLDVFGIDALFPVADTPLGRIANMICFDTMVAEVAHGLRRAGAEIILHSSSEPHGGSGREVWDTVRRLRAFENTCYVLSAIDGGEHLAHDSETLTFFRRGHSKMVRFDGVVEGTVDGPGPVAFRVGIDLAALRRARRNPFVNFSLWDDPAVYAGRYLGDIGFPSELWAGDPLVNPYAGARVLRERIASYVERGVYVPPVQALARTTIPDSV